jgi:DNA-binding CsgD family transcriptional regulator
MFETTTQTSSSSPASSTTPLNRSFFSTPSSVDQQRTPLRPSPYNGPERRSGFSVLAHLMAAMLDEIDYGMLMLDDENKVLYINHGAKTELGNNHPLCIYGNKLSATTSPDIARLQEALIDARQRGLRRLVSLGQGDKATTIAVIPLQSLMRDQRNSPTADGPITPTTLVMLGKKSMCQHLSVEAFARSYGLTTAETDVLKALCDGQRPSDIAQSKGVAVSTVRTQISKIRAKTGADSIAAAMHQVARLPPIVNALRCGLAETH